MKILNVLLCFDFYDSCVCVCVCEPADQLYRKDATYRGYLTWYIFRLHVYLPYLTYLPTNTENPKVSR